MPWRLSLSTVNSGFQSSLMTLSTLNKGVTIINGLIFIGDRPLGIGPLSEIRLVQVQ